MKAVGREFKSRRAREYRRMAVGPGVCGRIAVHKNAGPDFFKWSSVLGLESCFGTAENGFSVLGSESKLGEIEFDIKRAQSKSISKQWPAVKNQLELLAGSLSKTRLVSAITILSEARKRRFLRSRRPKYGSMNKAL